MTAAVEDCQGAVTEQLIGFTCGCKFKLIDFELGQQLEAAGRIDIGNHETP